MAQILPHGYIYRNPRISGHTLPDTILTGHSLKLFGRKDLKDWINVAEHPGLSHGKKQKGGAFAPGVTPLQVWAEEDTKHKGPSIVIDPDRIS